MYEILKSLWTHVRASVPHNDVAPDPASAWNEFLMSPFGMSASEHELALVWTRHPVQHRAPSVSLYLTLLGMHRGLVAPEQLEATIDWNERMDPAASPKI